VTIATRDDRHFGIVARGLASSFRQRHTPNFPGFFTHTLDYQRGELTALHARFDVLASVAPADSSGSSAKAERSFLPDRSALSGGTSNRRAAGGHGHFGPP